MAFCKRYVYFLALLCTIIIVHFAHAENPLAPACRANEGLRLLNSANPPFAEINAIIRQCDQSTPNDVQVLLLHGLLARKQGMANKSYQKAITWLRKAQAVAESNNIIPAAELAVTYEWGMQFKQAKSIYNQILTNDKNSRPALLGSARVALAQHDAKKARHIYQDFLQKNSADIDALNGLAWVQLSQQEFTAAKKNFAKVLSISPGNKDATIGLTHWQAAIKAKKQAQAKAIAAKKTPITPLCQANEGLRLLNLPYPPFDAIHAILALCDATTPNDVQVLLLHALLELKQKTCTYTVSHTPLYWLSRPRDTTAITPNACAIGWLLAAQKVAAPDNFAPTLELALIYERALLFNYARITYDQVLQQDPNSHGALLGAARIARAQYRINDAIAIYQYMLEKNPADTDALNGMAWIKLMKKKFIAAQTTFTQVLTANPKNEEAQVGLKQLDKTTRYTLDVLGGRINVGSEDSYTAHVNLLADINATDQILLFYEANTKQIGASFFTNPTLLPNNAVFLGFQRQIPDQYGWGGAYEYRQRTGLPTEHRFNINGNVFVLPRLQIFGGVREGFPFPWNNQLYYSGMMFFTNMPWNVSLTGFWGHEQVGGSSSAYSFDLSKEYYHAFYDIGTAYSPTLASWQVHGRFILPILKNQSIEANCEHYFFNNSTYLTAGWRFYWK